MYSNIEDNIENLTHDDIKKSISIENILEQIEIEAHEFDNIIPLTANENSMSRTASSFLDSQFSSRYHLQNQTENDFYYNTAKKGELYYRSLPIIFELEEIANSIAKKLFKADMVELRPLSGLHATICTLLSLTKVDDIVYSLDPNIGGHFASSPLLKSMGRLTYYLPWNSSDFKIDCIQLKKMISLNGKPKMILLDHGLTLFPLNVSELRETVGEETIIIYDASHTLGLIAGRQFQDPFNEGADVLQGNTHKTFPGPQKGVITSNSKVGSLISQEISSSLISSQHTHHSLSLYLTLLEMDKFAIDYANMIVDNSAQLANSLSQLGFKLISKGGLFTQSHMIVIEDINQRTPIIEACMRLQASGINVNARNYLGRPIIRIGVQEVTRLGMKPEDMTILSALINRAIKEPSSTRIQLDILNFRNQFKKINFSLDEWGN